MIRQSLCGHSVSQATRTHSSIWPCKEQLTGLVCCWLVSLCLCLCISMEALLNTGHMCCALPWVCVCMAPSLGSAILPSMGCSWECFYYCQQRLSWRAWYYTHIRLLPQRWPPLGQISPCTSSAPEASLHVCICVWSCRLPTCQTIKSMLFTESLLGPLPLPTSQPIKRAQASAPPPPDRPIKGRS